MHFVVGTAVAPDQRPQQHRSARHYLEVGPAMSRLDTTVALVARSLGFPMAMVNILDESTQYGISVLGVAGRPSSARVETVCHQVVTSERPLAVADIAGDLRFADLGAVRTWNMGSYLGVPLRGRESLVIGTLCVIDRRPRQLPDDAVTQLSAFGTVVEDQLELLRRLDEHGVGTGTAVEQLAAAIATQEIRPYFQPIVELATGRIVGFEALARWQPAGEPPRSPSSFLPLAEDSDLIVDLDLLIISQASRQLVHWQRVRPELRLSVNLSSRHFEDEDSVAAIAAAIGDAAPTSIDLEITETARLDGRRAVGIVNRLRDFGFQVWLDDFGTGWSALEHLLRLPVSGVKIDRAVTIALGSNLGNALTGAVAGLARELALQTTIEGIETLRQCEIAVELGCDLGQGYLWSRPVSAAAVDEMLAQETVFQVSGARAAL